MLVVLFVLFFCSLSHASVEACWLQLLIVMVALVVVACRVLFVVVVCRYFMFGSFS